MVKKTERQTKDCRFHPEGEVTIYTAQKYKALLLQVLVDCRSLSVDLSGVTEMDTAGVQILLLAIVEAKRKNIKIEFYGHTQAVNQILDMYDLSNIIVDSHAQVLGNTGSGAR